MTDSDDPASGSRPPGSPSKPASSIETAPTAGTREPGESTVEVAPEAFEPVPSLDPPSGEMRPLDPYAKAEGAAEAAAHPFETPASDVPPAELPQTFPALDLSQMPGYVPAPIPYDAPTQPTGPQPQPSTDAILPATYDEAALRDAVGPPPARPKRKRERLDDDGLPKPRRMVVLVALMIIVGLAIAGFVLLGRVNAQRYVIACSTTQITAEQGRGFPPWGTRPRVGPEWRPISLPANAECKPRETDDPAELERWYLDLLIDRASTTLAARNVLEQMQQKPNPLDVSSDQLNQALLLSRSPERRDQRKEVERLLGDVQYWRASLRLRDAAAALADAARQYDAAASQRPRHVTDAGEWATFLRRLVDELQAGPSGVPAAATPGIAAPPSERPSAPVGTALPVEPDQGSASEPPAAPPDAGLPTGGVLL